MPIYSFQCPSCNNIQSVNLISSQRNSIITCVECQHVMNRVYDLVNSEVRILASRHTGKTVLKGVSKILKNRRKKHETETLGDVIETHGLNSVKKTSTFKNAKRKFL